MFTWLEIDSGAIRHNLKQFRELIGPKVWLMPVVKANAYGHGMIGVAKICDQADEVDRICVVSLQEALELLDNGIKKPLFILSFFELDNPDNLKKAVMGGVIFTLYSLEQANVLNQIGKELNKRVKIHLKIDTGTGRTGILPHEALKFVKEIKSRENLKLEALWSHFASSEEDPVYTRKQFKTLKEVTEILKTEGLSVLNHIACSAAIAANPYSQGDAVRLGLSLYGLYPSEQVRNKINLKPALSWFTKIIQIKEVPEGVKIGYGGTWTTRRTTKLAILPIGYYDGYDRRFSNQAKVLIRGIKCPVVGRICMNLTMIDATGVGQARAGDKVILIGEENGETVTADDLASFTGTINYEIVDWINPLLPRFFK